MFSTNSKIPCFICFFFMESQPADDHSQLFARECPCKQFSINCYDSFIIAVINMDMRLVMLADIVK